MTQPDQTLPGRAWNSGDFGPISLLAGTSQSDWETQLFGDTAAPFQAILDVLFEGLITGISWPVAFLKMIVEQFFGWVPGSDIIFNIFDDLTEWLSNPGDLSNIPILGPLFGGTGNGIFLGNLIPGLDASKIVSGSLSWAVTGVQDLIDTMFGALTGSTQTNNLLSDILDALTNIPFLNVLGIGGPSDIGTSILSGWNNLISGFLGTPGTEDATLADLFNIPFEIASRASLGLFSWDILGQRDNTTLDSGLVPTSESTLRVTDAGAAVSATQAASPIGWQRIKRSAPLGVVGWRGYGNTNVTAFHVNVWKMNTTNGDVDLVHHSASIIGDISATDAWHEYELPVNHEIPAVAGEVYGTELVPIGSGTHTVLGKVVAVPDHPRVYPKRFAAVRNNNGGPTPPSSIASGSVVYSDNVPLIELSIKSGDVSEHTHAPQAVQLVTGGTVPIPSWANYVDTIILGGGGGGHAGGTFGLSGEGGDGGHWTSGTWQRTTHFGDGVIVTAAIGAGGIGGSGSGAAGGTTSVSIPGYSSTAAGGAGGDAYAILGSDKNGLSPGNATYNGVPYYGGVQQNSYGGDGNAPGGGGAGGNWLTFSAGGNGARGVVFLVFRQS